MNKSALSLSGGQQQRLCIARELTVEPEVLLLDEPCSALDIQNTMKIEEMLKNLSSKYTIVIVTHNLAQAKRIADKTAFFFDGELIEYNDTEVIFTNPKDEKTKNYINGIWRRILERVTKSDAKNSDVFERSEFRNFSQMSITLSLFFDMEFS